MSRTLHHYLLVFDRMEGRLVNLTDFGNDEQKAISEYARLEREHMADESRIEVVLIGSDSLETVKITHANYFGGTTPVSKYFAGI